MSHEQVRMDTEFPMNPPSPSYWRSKPPQTGFTPGPIPPSYSIMKKSLPVLIALALGATLTAQAVTKASPDPAPARNTPGVELAQTLSTVTGVAISPLLGVGAVGAWKYYHTLPEKRAT